MRIQFIGTTVVLLAASMLAACSGEAEPPVAEEAAAPAAPVPPPQVMPEDRRAMFGDLHIHTRYSFDAYIFGTRTTPDDAYRFARGETIQHPAGFDMNVGKPLDFIAVTDHASYIGMLPAMYDPESPVGGHDVAVRLREASTAPERAAMFQDLIPRFGGQVEDDDLINRDVMRSAWQDVIDAAERHNDPGNFTTFIAYEYTSSGDEMQNLHRNVVFRGSDVPADPFSRLDSLNPEDLWTWMDNVRDGGTDVMAIPHNSNGSDGMMFELTNWADEPIGADYAATRMRNEPVVEMTQVKGTSDTHPALSPNDEWADFGLMELRIATTESSRPEGSYVRNAFHRGLQLEETAGANPYKFALIGASDTHVSAGSFDESNYWSKVGMLDATAAQRGSVPLTDETIGQVNVAGSSAVAQVGDYSPGYYHTWGASGLAGVWADENTREAIFDAMRRKETFATSGPRMRVRMFAADDFDAGLAEANDAVAVGYASGVPMGQDLELTAGSDGPSFLVMAQRDPDEAALQRVQIIKGWIVDGEPQERVYDVACSDGGAVDPETHRCPDNGAAVNLADCSITAGVGADALSTVWADPDFDAGQDAFYYVRVLQNPTCRWSTWDAIRAGVAPREDLHATIQERAWSTPIWVYSEG